MGQGSFWNERYAHAGYAYGTIPNAYLKEKAAELAAGTILLPAEGEGRNAVFLATQGWETYAFDQSVEGGNKALRLAAQNDVEISYTVSNVENIRYPEKKFDALALIFAHFPRADRRTYHRKLSSFLKPGGHLIIEGFSKNHANYQQLNPKAGGPRDLTMLYDLEELKEDFNDFEFTEAAEQQVTLSEGEFHQGKASVIRIFAVKK
ncbi:class I SAM-dependent methyltransferase [Kaistella sp.]|uniref:class I SAM-dependent methyltransferase n=1 Tax=Kaistella sp. TaxID=2782235 RepID=UPI002F94BE32